MTSWPAGPASIPWEVIPYRYREKRSDHLPATKRPMLVNLYLRSAAHIAPLGANSLTVRRSVTLLGLLWAAQFGLTSPAQSGVVHLGVPLIEATLPSDPLPDSGAALTWAIVAAVVLLTAGLVLLLARHRMRADAAEKHLRRAQSDDGPADS